jgi:hypothetical protein
MYRGWTQTDYQSRHCAKDQKDEGTDYDRGRDGLTKFTFRIKEQAAHLTPFFLNMMMTMLSQTLLISSSSLKFSKAANLFVFSINYRCLNCENT